MKNKCLKTGSDGNVRRCKPRQKSTHNRLMKGLMLFCCGLFLMSSQGCGELLKKPAAAAAPFGQAVSPAVEQAAVESLLTEAVWIVRQALTDSSPVVRANAIEVTSSIKRIELMPKVERLLMDESMPVRFTAAIAVGDMQYSLAEQSLRRLLDDTDENVRIAAAYGLCKLGDCNSFSMVRKAIASDNQTVRANAAMLIGKSGSKDDLKFLYWTMRRKDSVDKVVFQSAEAIATLGDDRIYPKLWTMLISSYNDDRMVGVNAMGLLGTEQAKNALITMLNDNVLEVRLAAAGQLGKLGNSLGEPEVLDVFTKDLTAGAGKEELERVGILTALAIGEIGTEPLTKHLPQLLKNDSRLVRLAAAKAVFKCLERQKTKK